MPYVELHCHSAFSLLDGASHPVELAAAAAEQGHEALALTDHDSLGGVMELAQAAAPLGVRTITGAELTLVDDSHLTLLCENRTGYSNLCRLLTKAHQGTRGEARDESAVQSGAARAGGDGGDLSAQRAQRSDEVSAGARTRAPIRPAQVTLEEIESHAEGLVCLTGCASNGLIASRVARNEHAEAAALGSRLLAAFGPDHLRVELQRPFARHDRQRNRLLASLAGPARRAGGGHRQRPCP